MIKATRQFRTRKTCPFCGSVEVSKYKPNHDYLCVHCRKHFATPILKSVKDRTQRPKFIKGVI